MNKFYLLVCSVALTFLAMFPATAAANDKLEVTMEVFDDVSELDGDLTEMQGPDGEHEQDDLRAGEEDRDGEGEDVADWRKEDFVADASQHDDFEHDDKKDGDGVRELESESDFEEGEDVDDDFFGDDKDDGEHDVPMDGDKADGEDAGFDDDVASDDDGMADGEDAGFDDDVASDDDGMADGEDAGFDDDVASDDDGMLADEGADGVGEGEGTGEGDI